jgi:small nuclear ribonucleoprotein (snRNP)-like protein
MAEEATITVRKLLGTLVRAHVTDGRSFVGTLACVDGAGNTVLSECEEWAPAAEVAQENRVEAARRWVGLLNIKPALLVKLDANSAALASR